MQIHELIKRYNSKEKDPDYWRELKKDMETFLSEDHPEKEKRVLSPIGLYETVTMIVLKFDEEAKK